MTFAGIDEAGYGPRLGPLCVAAARIHGPEGATAADLDAALAAAAGEAGVPVGDSKRVHRPGAGTGALEAAVLPFAAADEGGPPEDAGAWMRSLGAVAAPPPPWYGEVPARALPGAATPRARELAAALGARGLRVRLRARVLPEDAYNAAVAAAGNKAAVLFDLAASLLEEIAAAGPAEVLCDRHGGRASYGPPLQRRFPALLAVPVREGRKVSAYDLRGGPAPLRVRFEVEADGRSAAAGLASCTAKLLREWHMEALNRFVLAAAPGVRPTAGYWTDGTRFLVETEAARRALRIDDRAFVRAR